MADHFEFRYARTRAGLLVEIDREHLFEFHAGPEVPERSIGVQYARLAAQVALLTNAVPGAGWELGGAEDRIG
jgi:hypothetical protein